MAQFRCLTLSIVYFLTITIVFGEALAQKTHSSRIVNGEITQISKHPYIVSVHRRSCKDCVYSHYCGGTIYNENFIITAATCVRNADSNDLLVVAGSSFRTGFLNDGGIILPVAEFTTHRNETIDLAIVRLGLKIPLGSSSTIQAVSIASETPVAGTMAIIAGWGRLEDNGEYSEKLREASISILDVGLCQGIDNEICAGKIAGGIGGCQGDAGGPLLVNGQLVGVTSWSVGCSLPEKPGVYTNVVKLNNWIVSHILGVRIAFL